MRRAGTRLSIRSFAVGPRAAGIELSTSAVWFPADKELVRYSKLFYVWDQLRGEIGVWEKDSRRVR